MTFSTRILTALFSDFIFQISTYCFSADLSKATEYNVRIQAFNSNGTGPASQWLTVETYSNDLDGKCFI